MTGDLPLPDLPESLDLQIDESALRRPSARPSQSFLVRIGAVRDPVELAPAFAEILRVDLPTAQRIAVNAPGVLVAGVSRETAEDVAERVRALGVKATPQEEVAPAPSEHPPGISTSSRPPSARPPAARGGLSPSPRVSSPAPDASGEGPGEGFWAQTPVAFMAPFLGRGWALLAASGVAGVGVGLVVVVPGFLIKLGALIGLQLVAFGLFVESFNRLAQAATYRDSESWFPEPMSELPNPSALFWRGLVNVLVFAMLASPAVALALYTDSVFVALVAQIALFLYWPMALTVQSVSGRLAGPLDVLAVARGVVVAPVEYLSVCLLTFAAIAGSTLVVVAATGVGALAIGASDVGLGGGAMLYAFVAFAWYAAIGYFHGVLGYLMGSLVRSRSEAFEFLHES